MKLAELMQKGKKVSMGRKLKKLNKRVKKHWGRPRKGEKGRVKVQ